MPRRRRKAPGDPSSADTVPVLYEDGAGAAGQLLGLPAIGTLIDGKYRVVEILGTGAMGAVMMATDVQLQRDVAIKLVHSHLLEQGFYQRFLVEARAMARVRHENVVTIYSFGSHEGSPYFVMELVPGLDLEQWLKSNAPLAIDEALGILRQVCRGVAAIHEAGAVHRDIKPANILVGSGFRLVVTDLGLAQLAHDSSRAPGGSPDFMAPELIEHLDVPAELAPQVDVYALGILTFLLLTGELPFKAENVRAALYQQLVGQPPKPSDVRPELLPVFDEPVLAALAKEPADRPAGVMVFWTSLLEARRALTTRLRPALSVLIADDDVHFRRFAERIVLLELPQARIVTAEDGTAALQELLAAPIDLALIDLDMPGLNGLELISALRASRQDIRTKIVVITAVGGAGDWKVLSTLGTNAFLLKPVQPEELARTIARLTGRPSIAP